MPAPMYLANRPITSASSTVAPGMVDPNTGARAVAPPMMSSANVGAAPGMPMASPHEQQLRPAPQLQLLDAYVAV